MDRYRALTRERADIEPVVARYREYARAEADVAAADEMARDPADEGLRRRGARGGDGEDGRARGGPAAHAAAAGPQRRAQRLPRNPRRHGRRRVGALRRQPLPDVHALRRARGLEGRDRLRVAGRARRLQGSDPAHHRARRLLEAQVRVGRPSRAARAGDRGAGPHPHVGVHGRRDARSRSGRRHRRSIPPTSASTRSARRARAASTSTRPIRRCGSRICRPGIVVECQDDRSQHRNRAQAMAVLASRLLDRELRERQQKEASMRKSLVGSGDRSERIRTYNFPQGRVTDHRINLTLHKIDAIMDGDLDELDDGARAGASGRACWRRWRRREDMTAKQAKPSRDRRHGSRRCASSCANSSPTTSTISARLDRDPRVMKYIGNGKPSTRDGVAARARAHPRAIRRLYPDLGIWHASRRDTGAFIGWFSLKYAGKSPDIEVGYRLLPDAWGQRLRHRGRAGAGRLRLRRSRSPPDHRRHASRQQGVAARADEGGARGCRLGPLLRPAVAPLRRRTRPVTRAAS